jgi:protein-tyrosine-phosphatase
MMKDAREQGDPVRLLFICFENSCRSQMAEAFARAHGAPGTEAFSAGSRPSGVVNPTAILVMGEVGYDLASHRSKAVGEVPSGSFDVVVSMGCGDDCPVVPARRREEWEIPDPKEMPLAGFREVRDRIETEVSRLLESLGAHR